MSLDPEATVQNMLLSSLIFWISVSSVIKNEENGDFRVYSALFSPTGYSPAACFPQPKTTAVFKSSFSTQTSPSFKKPIAITSPCFSANDD